MPRLTERQKAKIKRLCAQGLSDDAVAEQVPCSRGAVHYYRRYKHVPARLYTPEEDAVVERIFAADMTRSIMERVRDIATELDRTTGSVHARLNFLGLIKTGEHKPPQALKPWPAHAKFTSPEMKPLHPAPHSGSSLLNGPARHFPDGGSKTPPSGLSIPSQGTPSCDVPAHGPGAGEARPLQEPPRQTSEAAP